MSGLQVDGELRERLVRQAQRLVGASDAEDVAHDALVRAVRTTTFREGGQLVPWLSRITRNVAYDALRRRLDDVAMIDPPSTETPERELVRSETREALRIAIERLPEALRRALVLHDVHGYTSAEVADVEGIPYHTARTRLFRARRAVRSTLDADLAHVA